MAKKAKSGVELYLDAVGREMACSRKQKATYLNRLRRDVEEFADTADHELTQGEIEAHFGKPAAVARNFLETLDYSELKKNYSVKKIVLFCVIVTCLVALLAIFGNILYHFWLDWQYSQGYIVETLYESVEGPLPEIPEGARVY